MNIKLKALTAEQVKAVREEIETRHPGILVGYKTTYVILRSTPERGFTIVQEVMDEIREKHGARYPNYRALVAVRNKLELATKAPNGVTAHVSIEPNGTSTGEVPEVLNGAKVVEAEPVAPLKRGRGSKGAARPGFSEVRTSITYPEGMAPTLPQPVDTPASRANFEYMLAHAPSESAARFWRTRLNALPQPANV